MGKVFQEDPDMQRHRPVYGGLLRHGLMQKSVDVQTHLTVFLTTSPAQNPKGHLYNEYHGTIRFFAEFSRLVKDPKFIQMCIYCTVFVHFVLCCLNILGPMCRVAQCVSCRVKISFEGHTAEWRNLSAASSIVLVLVVIIDHFRRV